MDLVELRVEVNGDLILIQLVFHDEDILLLHVGSVEVADLLNPIIVVTLLERIDVLQEGFSEIFEGFAFRVIFPIVTKNLLHSFKVNIQFTFDLLSPSYLARDRWEISSLVKNLILFILFFVHKFFLQTLHILVNLLEEFVLIFLNSPSDFRSREQGIEG